MKLLVKQTFYRLGNYHEKTLQGAFIWWLTRKTSVVENFVHNVNTTSAVKRT